MIDKYLNDLMSAGLSERKIAQLCGCTQPTINRIRNGRQAPGYALGSKIADLAKGGDRMKGKGKGKGGKGKKPC